MKRIAAALVMVVALTGCYGRNTREEIKDVDGQKFLCTWTEGKVNWKGDKSDYRCEAFNQNATTTVVP